MSYDGEEWRIFRKSWEAEYFERASECGRHTKSSVFAGVVASEWVHYWVSLGVLRRDV